MEAKSPAHFLPIVFLSLSVPFCHFLDSKTYLEKAREKTYQKVENMRAACNPPMPAHVSQRAFPDFCPLLPILPPLWTTLFRSENRRAKKNTKKTQKRRLNMFFGDLGRKCLQIVTRGDGERTGFLDTFSLFFTPPAPKAAQRDPSAPPASK